MAFPAPARLAVLRQKGAGARKPFAHCDCCPPKALTAALELIWPCQLFWSPIDTARTLVSNKHGVRALPQLLAEDKCWTGQSLCFDKMAKVQSVSFLCPRMGHWAWPWVARWPPEGAQHVARKELQVFLRTCPSGTDTIGVFIYWALLCIKPVIAITLLRTFTTTLYFPHLLSEETGSGRGSDLPQITGLSASKVQGL